MALGYKYTLTRPSSSLTSRVRYRAVPSLFLGKGVSKRARGLPRQSLPKDSFAELLPLFAGYLFGEVNKDCTIVVFCHTLICHDLGVFGHGLFRHLAFTTILVESDVETSISLYNDGLELSVQEKKKVGQISHLRRKQHVPLYLTMLRSRKCRHWASAALSPSTYNCQTPSVESRYAAWRDQSYHFLEVSTGSLVQALGFELGRILALLLLRLNGFLLGRHFSVDADVELEEMINGVPLELLLAPVQLEGKGQQAILLAPVAEV